MAIAFRSFANSLEMFLQLFQVFVRKFFNVDKFIARIFEGTDELIEFQLGCLGIAVLRVLNKEDHEKSDNGRASINDELPGIRKMEDRTGGGPRNNDKNCEDKDPRAPQKIGGLARKNVKGIPDRAKNIARLFSLF